MTKKPLITKLSPNQTDIKENARRCIEAGSDGLAVINTIMGMAIDVQSRRPVIGNIQGGLSGPAIKPIALLKVHQVYEVAKPHRIPIIGQGGITTATDALEFLIAGASAVGIGTALFYDPMVCKKINRGIAEYLRANGMANVTELVGTLAHRQRNSGHAGFRLRRRRARRRVRQRDPHVDLLQVLQDREVDRLLRVRVARVIRAPSRSTRFRIAAPSRPARADGSGRSGCSSASPRRS